MDKATTDIGLVQDIRGLDQLRKLSNQGDASQQQALEAAARQFEAIFNQMWVGSMRQANSAIAPDSPLNSRYSQFFQGMLDEQMTASMASPKSNSSLSRLIVKQLSPKSDIAGDPAPRALKMPDERLLVMRRFARWEGNNSQNSVTDAVGTDGAYTGNNARADSAVQAGVAAAERFVARMERMQRQGNGGSDSAAASNFSSPEAFVRQLLPAAREVASRIGLSPVALLAQAALETGWGRNMMKNSDGSNGNNLFGIKAGRRWQGNTTQADSLEFEQGQAVMRNSSFRSYRSFVQSMEDYVNLIGNDARYSKAKAVAHDPDAYFEALQQAGYATDPQYADKLKRVIRSDAFAGLRSAAEI